MNKVRSSRIIYDGFFKVREDILARPDGMTVPYTSLEFSGDATAVLAQDESGRWILNREYRYPTREHLLGCPGGRLETGEDPIEGGRRELLEETGYWSDDVRLIGCSYPFPAICNQKIYYLWAKNAVNKGPQKLDAFELIETELKTNEELHREIRKGTRIDGILCAALWYFSLTH